MFESVSLFFASAFAAVIVLWSAWFWVTAVGLFFLVLLFEENDRNFFAGLSVLAFVWVMESSGAINIFTSPLTVAYWGAIYMALGAGWSFVKWFSFLHQSGDKFEKLKLTWLKDRNKAVEQSNERNEGQADYEPGPILAVDIGTKIPKDETKLFREYLYNKGFIRSERAPLIPQISDNKAKVTGWIVWWPWSALWTVLNDPIRRLAEAIYNQLQTTYQRLANHVFAKFQVEDEG